MIPSSLNFELMPMPIPTTETALQLWKQLPDNLKERGFGLYMSQHDDDYTMTDIELYLSFLACYYYFNHQKDSFSFRDWRKTVEAKVGSYKPGVTPEQAAIINEQVDTEQILYVEGAIQLFSRQQLNYFGW